MLIFRDLAFPEGTKNEVIKQFIKSLLRKRINQRNCNFNLLKVDPFFNGFNFV
jgi:hypothetical protein